MSAPRPAARNARRVELHTHTVFSDGQLTPEALVAHAIAAGLDALAVTDHDTLDALPRARQAAGDALELVPGIEISTSHAGLDLHVLGYFVDPDDPPLLGRLAQFRLERRQRVRGILDRLAELGVRLDEQEVLDSAGPGTVGRPHVANALIRGGHVPNMEAAFQRYLSPRGRAFVPRPEFRPEDAIAHIRAAGGVAVLAHPGTSVPDPLVEHLSRSGLAGVEVWHPQHGPAAVRRWRDIARRLGLVPCGGSDFHGPHRGVELGSMAVPESSLESLRRAATSTRLR